jgi:hypothetical protein
VIRFDSLEGFGAAGGAAIGAGPAALTIVEDAAEIAATLDHLAARGFRSIIAFAPPDLALPDLAPPGHPALTATVATETRRPDACAAAVNAAIAAARPGTWLHYGFNAEYLMHPFCEHRTVGEMLAFHAEERRDAMLAYVVDLYAADLAAHPSGVDRATAHLDRAGYFALPRTDAEGRPRERQLDFFGGLRWRFEEHVAPDRRRIDRVALFRARPGLRLRDDHTFTAEEYNTYACPWHNNLTAAVCSFRAAKALRANPISRDAIDSFTWPGAAPFRWESRQLMELGLMEPGQWF